MIFQKLQPHTVDIYNLNSKKFQVKTVKARTLLTTNRFDLFAKLYYISTFKVEYKQAVRVYSEHIKAFNPDLKEPGRNDKNSITDFIDAFNQLITEFKISNFDSNCSLIPVDSNGVILDGAHRVSVLAFYDKEITIVQFDDSYAKCKFDYTYFKERGLSWEVLDIIAHEMTKWIPNLLVACIWPKVNKLENRDYIKNYISTKYKTAYIKQYNLGLSSLTNFIKLIYSNQDWTRNECAVNNKALNCFSSRKLLTFVFFESSNNLEQILLDKSIIREQIGFGNHSLHITDNIKETIEISELVNTKIGINLWYKKNKAIDKFTEKLYYFKKVQWLNFKVTIVRYINAIIK